MRHLEFRNKRDKNGLLLKNAAYSLSYDFTNHCIDIISKYEIYGKLSSYFGEKNIEFHFRKFLLLEFLPIAHQLTIKQWDDENNDNGGIVSIDASTFNCSELLKTIELIKNDNLIFDFNGSLTVFQKAKKKYRPLVKILKKIQIYLNRISPFSYSNNENVTSLDSANSSRVALSLGEGFDLNKRSNIFWLADSDIDPSSVLIYFSSSKMTAKRINSKQSESLIRKLKEKKLQWVDLKEWSAPNKLHLGNNIIDFIKNKKPDNKIHKWILMESYNLIREINYWYSFFQYFDIKIHSDFNEHAIDTIAKQIALDRLNGVSFIAQRSYPEYVKGKFYCSLTIE